MITEIEKNFSELQGQIQNLIPNLNLPQKKQKILELQEQMQSESFWHDQDKAKSISKLAADLEKFVGVWEQLQAQLEENLKLTQATEPGDANAESYLTKEFERLKQLYTQNRLTALLSKKYDDHEAILAIHAGAGGTDAQDWAEILLRMYLRFADKKEFVVDMVETSRGGEAGIKSVLMRIQGAFAYGLLKTEAGVHRLVRLSPFNPAHTRETSFALVEVLPHLDTAEELKIDPKDLKIEANTSSGHGGQSVNTTYSAIRITHIPTGLKVSIQNERSQHQNRELAMKILMARLVALEDERLRKEKKELRGEFKSAEWGNQIRSYVLHPYKLVKDHRTGFETSDPEAVLDGDLDDFIEKSLEIQVE
jgi:peptide chain release factor 2